MRLEARDLALLQDMLAAAKEAGAFISGMTEAAFLKDKKTQKAVERELEIIGEAAKGLSQAARDQFPHVPFRSMIGMRNILAQDYGHVDPKELWKTVQEALPALVKDLRVS